MRKYRLACTGKRQRTVNFCCDLFGSRGFPFHLLARDGGAP